MMNYKFTPTEEWQEVTYSSIVECKGNFGIYYDLFIRVNGELTSCFITKNQYQVGTPPFKKLEEFEKGKKFMIRKTGITYPKTEWSLTSEDVKKAELEQLI